MWPRLSALPCIVNGGFVLWLQAIDSAKLLDVSARCLRSAHQYVDNSQVGGRGGDSQHDPACRHLCVCVMMCVLGWRGLGRLVSLLRNAYGTQAGGCVVGKQEGEKSLVVTEYTPFLCVGGPHGLRTQADSPCLHLRPKGRSLFFSLHTFLGRSPQ